ncbi:MAG TPA: UDP-N-acetylmuramoyl-tripeptide--D-alanyl-D-alanine ligase [Bdellovibrionales bacterium]|nr:UDP-N-acetylmuramoyl-tripeptide--D-alanyl-D-alanine ligase [Bdellovibrionales bacterium]
MAGSWTCTLDELVLATGGMALSKTHASFSRVSTDTRDDLKGRLFIPLKGDKFDAHDFVTQAVEKGAAAVVVQNIREEWRPLFARASFIKVGDTLQALQGLARFWRRKHKYKVIAITGSNGKTTTKEFTYALLKPHFRVHASKGSFNNHWGVPLSILAADSSHTHLVLEMGMNHAGEIWKLCAIAEPDVSVVTTVGRAHIGELGSQANVAQAKEEIYVATPKATHVFNVDNEWTMRMQTRSHSKQIQFSSFRPKVDVSLRAQKMNWDGLEISGTIQGVNGQASVPVLGRHNVVNLMAAAALGLAAGLSPAAVWKGLGAITDSAWGRNQMLKLQNGDRVLFDAYNANPDSVHALIKNLYEMEIEGRKFLILGDMRELGEFSEAAHEEIGEKAAAIPFEAVWFIGAFAKSFWKGFEKCRPAPLPFSSAQVEAGIAKKFLDLLRAGDLVAIKGSRGMELEHVLDGWPLATPLGSKP